VCGRVGAVNENPPRYFLFAQSGIYLALLRQFQSDALIRSFPVELGGGNVLWMMYLLIIRSYINNILYRITFYYVLI